MATVRNIPDRVLDARIILNQPETGYRAAIDPVLLAEACPATAGDHVLDAGCGVGTAALCLIARTGCRATGIELQPPLVELAVQNAAENGFAERFSVVTGSIMAGHLSLMGEVDRQSRAGEGVPIITPSPSPLLLKGARENLFDHIICNPPYLSQGYGSGEPSLANNESDAKLADWIAFAIRRVKEGGSIVFIHRADRLDEVLAGFSGRLGAISILPLLPHAGEPAHRVLVGGIRGRKTPLRLLAGRALHNADGGYTAEADAILRNMQPLELW